MVARGGVVIGSSYDEARTRKMNADAEIAELELSKVRGELVETQQVIDAWVEVLSAMRAKMLSLPSVLAPVVANDEDVASCQDIIEKQVYEALEELASYEPQGQDNKKNSKRSNGQPEASAKNDGVRLGRPRKTTKLRK